MKKITLLSMLLILTLYGAAQFVTMPLDYPDDNTAYMSWYMSIVDDDNIWVATIHEGQNGFLPYNQAVRTTDGGLTWEFKTIPVTGTPWIQHLAAADANTCYYIYIDGVTYESGIWKTSDGGDTWAKVTTTQFQGGWPNSIYCYSADTVVVMGDPNGGYFEIQLTFDGGNTWTRVPQSDVPASLPNEWSTQGNHFEAGNTIGFGTAHGRCIHSHDRGLHWEATQVVDEYMEFSFSDDLHGTGFRPGTSKSFYLTEDGGNTWSGQQNPTTYVVTSMSSVPGILGGYVFNARDSLNLDTLHVIFTSNFFGDLEVIGANITNASSIQFGSNTNGWLGGGYFWYHNIHKFIGVLTSLPEPPTEPGMLSIAPNPASGAAYLRVPKNWIGRQAELYVIDLTGRSILQRAIGELPELVSLSAAGMPEGVYVVRVVANSGESLSQKWVIRR
jgi:photosystem II stability/assembly factor-like uncharacterized protein